MRDEPLRLESSPETRGVPSSGAGPSQNGTCSGGGIGRKIRAGRSTVNYFRFGGTRVCITPISLHRVKIIGSGSLGKNCSKKSCKQSYHTFIILYFRPSFLSCLLHSRNSCSGPHSRPFSPLPTTCYGGGNSPQVDILFSFLGWKSLNDILLANTRRIHQQPAHSSKGKDRYSQRGTMT